MSTVYLVTSGGSEHYNVQAVCSTEELAQRCVEELQRRDAERSPISHAHEYIVEPMELDGIFAERRVQYWQARVDSVINDQVRNWQARVDSVTGKLMRIHSGFAYVTPGELASGAQYGISYVSEEHAIRLAIERLVKRGAA